MHVWHNIASFSLGFHFDRSKRTTVNTLLDNMVQKGNMSRKKVFGSNPFGRNSLLQLLTQVLVNFVWTFIQIRGRDRTKLVGGTCSCFTIINTKLF